MTRSANRIAAAAVVIVAVTATAVAAAPGDLDPALSMDGIAIVDFGGTSQEFQRGAPDEAKVVAVGAVDDDFAIARLLAGGAPDDGFADGDGSRTLDFGHEDIAYGVAVHPDGKLVVVGETYDGAAGKFFAMRLKANGRIDRSFGGDGKVLVNPGPGEDGAWRVALIGTGRLVLAGWSEDGSGGDRRSVAVRLLPDGRRDRSFDGDGIWVMDLSPGGDDDVVGLDLTDDDQILLGVDLFSTSYDPHIVKLRKGGALDPRFGGGDGISSNWADGYRLVDVEVRIDGQIAGTLLAAEIASFRLGRRGAPLASYGTNGLVFTSTPMNAEAMYLDEKHRPVITGSLGGNPEVIRLQS